MKDTITNANFPKTADGRVYHLGLRSGEVANRIIVVGDPARAQMIAKYLDKHEAPKLNESVCGNTRTAVDPTTSKAFTAAPGLFALHSERGFLTMTGTYKGVPISIASIGMGFPNMDFFLRECRELLQGEMVVVRFGSCGSLVERLPVASLSVPKSSVAISRNYDFDFLGSDGMPDSSPPYRICKPAPADPTLHNLVSEYKHVSPVPATDAHPQLLNTLRATVTDTTVNGDFTNASTDSFYASQGRITSFPDHNEELINHLDKGIGTLEMETFHLLHLASCWPRRSNPPRPGWAGPAAPPSHEPAAHVVGFEVASATDPAPQSPSISHVTAADVVTGSRIRAAAVQMIFADRSSQVFITPEQVQSLENDATIGLLEAIIAFGIPEELLHPTSGSVWEPLAE